MRTNQKAILFSDVKLSDGKGLQGSGRLTLARIDSFQTFYGITLRSNQGNLAGMVRGTKAILKHYSDPADHSDCSTGNETVQKIRLSCIFS